MFLRNTFFYMAGIAFMALSRVKYILKGYSTPKPYGISDYEKCIEYDIHVVEQWLSYLQKYTHIANFHVGKNILELGPGSDLGAGIYLLSKGCSQYNACDVNDLMKSTTENFYEHFFRKLENINDQANIDSLKRELKETLKGNPSRLNYVVRNDFDIVSTFGKATVDLVFSQAAFEHFDNIDATISQLSAACKPGAILISEIDLITHSRWIRDKDPNNIYRYPSYIYNTFWSRGSPNRVRPFQYKETFDRFGWTDISIIPIKKLNGHDSNYSGMNKTFADDKNQMDYLTIMLCATKGAKTFNVL